MKLKLLFALMMFSQIASAGQPQLNLRCVNRATFLPEPPHLGDIHTDESRVLIRVKNVTSFGGDSVKELVAVLDPNIMEEELNFIDIEFPRGKCDIRNARISEDDKQVQRLLPTLACMSHINGITPAQVRIHLKDGSQKLTEAIMEVSLYFEGRISAWSTTSLDQHLSISILDPKTLWKQLASIEVLAGRGAVCEPQEDIY